MADVVPASLRTFNLPELTFTIPAAVVLAADAVLGSISSISMIKEQINMVLSFMIIITS